MEKVNMKQNGFIHSIETMGLLDGPGNRTIFFLQGCPLRCKYCHNPDSQVLYAGKEYSVEDLIKIARRYRPYQGEEGGVTLSGGEPLLQGEFVYQLLRALKEEKINTCLDTSGVGGERYYSRILPLVDTMLLDFKAFDEVGYKSLTKGNLVKFNKFVNELEKNGFTGQIWARHVMVPGYTDNQKAMRDFAGMLEPVRNRIERIEILPYHTAAIPEYDALGIEYELEGIPPMNRDIAKDYERYVNRLFAENLSTGRRKNDILYRRKVSENEMYDEKEKAELLEAINSVGIFEGIEGLDIARVAGRLRLLHVKVDDYVFRSGDDAQYMYAIYKGIVKVFHSTIDGKEQILYLYNENDFVGGLNLLDHSSYMYMGQALTDCEVIAIPRDIFAEYILESPAALKKLLRKSFERIRCAEDLIQRLSTSNATMKTAGLLLRLRNSIGVQTEEGVRLELSLNREELGNYSGLTRETITRKLGEFKELGYIDLIGNKIIILKDIKTLEEIVF